MARDGVNGILDLDRHLMRPGVAIKDRANQLAVFRPGVKRICGAVRSAESLAVAYKRKQVSLLLRAQGQLAAREEKQDIEIAQTGRSDPRQIFGCGHFDQWG